MKLLNVGCGAVRPPAPWINMDNLHGQLKIGSPERTNLDREDNYVDHDIANYPWPFPDNGFDGILVSHVLEHFDCHGAVGIIKECHRILRIAGLCMVSVPDSEYFLSVHGRDTPENAIELFGEPICPDEPWHKSFFDYALFYNQHKQVLSYPSLRCLMIRGGFGYGSYFYAHPIGTDLTGRSDVFCNLALLLNRRKFSVEICAVK